MALTTAQKEALAELAGSTTPYKKIGDLEGSVGLGILAGQAAAVADITVTYSSNDPSITPNGAITIADGSVPTVAELLEFCEELKAKVAALVDALQAAGLMA